MGNTAIRLVLINDYDLVVRGIAHMLAPFKDRVAIVDMVVGQPSDTEADVILYDSFAARRGKEFAPAEILKASRATHLIVYTWDLDAALAEATMNDGVSGYLSKQLQGEALVSAIEEIHAGQTVKFLAPPSGAFHGDWPGKREGLSEREAEIIALIVQGLSNHDLADRVFLSINTIKSYIRSAYRKMGVTSRSQAVLWGIAHGFRTVKVGRLDPHRDVL